MTEGFAHFPGFVMFRLLHGEKSPGEPRRPQSLFYSPYKSLSHMIATITLAIVFTVCVFSSKGLSSEMWLCGLFVIKSFGMFLSHFLSFFFFSPVEVLRLFSQGIKMVVVGQLLIFQMMVYLRGPNLTMCVVGHKLQSPPFIASKVRWKCFIMASA